MGLWDIVKTVGKITSDTLLSMSEKHQEYKQQMQSKSDESLIDIATSSRSIKASYAARELKRRGYDLQDIGVLREVEEDMKKLS